jgi:uncharacterized protein (TIGR01777 family)
MRVTLTGATGLIGTKLVAELKTRGDDVTVLSRDPVKASDMLRVDGVEWDPRGGPAPADALDGRDAIVHLAGEPIAQRWNAKSKKEIHDSRERGTRNLVDGIRATDMLPSALISSSAVGYYGEHGDEKVTEASPPGSDFTAEVCVAWEHEAIKAEESGLRVARIRTGVVLDAGGGALAKMLPFFKLGIGGPVAGGGQYLSWIHADDLVALYLAAIDGDWSGPFNASAPEPSTNKEFSKALGRAIKRPAFAPVPSFAIKILYGQMAEIVTEGQRVVPEAALAEGFEFKFTDVDEALKDALA